MKKIIFLFVSMIIYSYSSAIPVYECPLEGDAIGIQSRNFLIKKSQEAKKARLKPLEDAIKTANILLVKDLVDSDDYLKSKAGKLLISAIKANSARLLSILLEAEIDSNFRVHESFWTPIECACFYNRVQLVKILLRYGADAKYGLQPAVKAGNLKIVKILLLAQKKVNAKIKAQELIDGAKNL